MQSTPSRGRIATSRSFERSTMRPIATLFSFSIASTSSLYGFAALLSGAR
jgi:hypothetical protein